MDHEVDHREQEQQPHEPAGDPAPENGVLAWREPGFVSFIDQRVSGSKRVRSRSRLFAPEMRGGIGRILESELQVVCPSTNLESNTELVAHRLRDVR